MIFKKYFIPNIISLSSILCGFIAIILASYGYNFIKYAALLIILGAVFDGLDGRIARALNVTNKLGKEMDSLADLTTFGLATGILLYQGSLYRLGNVGILIAAFIPMFGAVRLARFNLRPTKKDFEGMPTTWAGISIAILQGFYGNYFTPSFYMIYAITVSFLMVSKFKYIKPNLAFFKLLSSKIVLSVGFVMIFVKFPIAFLIPLFWYSISGIFFTLMEQREISSKTLKVKM